VNSCCPHRFQESRFARLFFFVAWLPLPSADAFADLFPFCKSNSACDRKGSSETMPDKQPGKEAEKRKEDLDKKLDEQLEESFPTSDPPSLSQPTPNKPAGDPNKGKR
jgi:hypothetical protein